jgi:pyrimidine operon attenuation protein/uracil phosphoribosyltransferase
MSTIALPDAEALCAELLRQLRPLPPDTGVVGIVTGGAWLAERLHRELGLATPLGTLDVSFYRDDFGRAGLKKQVRPSQIPFDVQGRNILLVDDVLYTGRTVRAAMNELFDYGRPARIDLAVLVDRGGRELPIAARYRGGEFAVPAGKILMLECSESGESGTLVLALSDQRRNRGAHAA